MTVRKAVIPAAGLGTRFLPASKVVPKNLIPVVDKPMIQYAVEELVRAGIEDICIVISKGLEALVDHFRPDEDLRASLTARGKDDLLRQLLSAEAASSVTAVYQDEPLGLGHAVGVASDFVGGEPFACLLPDELFHPSSQLLSEMVASFEATGANLVAAVEVPSTEIGRYGVIDPVDADASPIIVRGVVEKPAPSEAPSNLALAGRYVLEADVMDIIGKLDPGAGGEIQLTDALGVLASSGTLHSTIYRGRKWDVGNPQGFLQATFELAQEHPTLGKDFKRFIEEKHDGP